MILTAALLAVVATIQSKTVTVTSPVAPSAVVLAQLGKVAGVDLKADRSVEMDYFFVRFKDTPLDTAMERVAKTLNATWVKRADGGYTLLRTSKQEAADAAPSEALVKSISRGLDDLKLGPFGAKELGTFMKRFDAAHTIDGEAAPTPHVREAGRRSPESDIRPIARLSVRMAKLLGAKEIASLPSGDKVWYTLEPTRWQRPMNVAMAGAARTYLAEEATFQRALAEARVEGWSSVDLSRPVQIGFSVTRMGQTVQLTTVVSQGSDAFEENYGSNLNDDGDDKVNKASLSDSLTQIKDEAKLSPHALEYYDSTNTEVETPVFTDGKPMWSWLLQNPDGHDFLDLTCADVLVQTADIQGKDMVALLPDGAGYSLIYGYESAHQALGDLWAAAETATDAVTVSMSDGYISVLPLEPAQSRLRLDRKALATYASRRASGPVKPDDLAAFIATTPTPTTFDTADSILKFVAADSTEGLDNSAADMMRFYSQMSGMQRQAAGQSGWQARLDDLPAGMRRLIERVLFADDAVVPIKVQRKLPDEDELYSDDDQALRSHASFLVGNGWPPGSLVRLTAGRKESVFMREGSEGSYFTRSTSIDDAVNEADAASYGTPDADSTTTFAVAWLTSVQMTIVFPGLGEYSCSTEFPELKAETTFYPADRLPGSLGKALAEALAERRAGNPRPGQGRTDIPPKAVLGVVSR